MNNTKLITLIVLALCLLVAASCTQNTEKYLSVPEWTLIYKNSHSGESLYGSKKDLIYALRAGSPLRIGFGGHRLGDTLRSIEHLADAQFISIANSKEVFAQINTFIGQDPSLDEEPLSIQFHKDRKFSMIACTNGSVSSLSINFVIDTLKSPNPSNRGFSWYVQQFSNIKSGQPPVEPLWKNPRKR